MTVHVLKTDGEYFDDVKADKKPFEVRVDDREPPYETGDVVVLLNTGSGPDYHAFEIRRIGYVARGRRIPEGYCVFELRPEQTGDRVRAEMALGRTEVSSQPSAAGPREKEGG